MHDPRSCFHVRGLVVSSKSGASRVDSPDHQHYEISDVAARDGRSAVVKRCVNNLML